MSEPTPEEELMIPDQLDELLDVSAPPRTTIEAADARAMAIAAEREVRRPRRTRRAVTLSGALALLLIGGAGVATATSEWRWGDGLESPDRSYSYTAPTWGECEIRFSGIEPDNIFIRADVNRIIDDWFATADVEAAAAPFVGKYLAVLENSQAEDPEAQTDPRIADLNAWTAHEQALGDALYAELKVHGYEPGDLAGSGSHSQLHCEGEDWGGEGGTP